MVSKKKRRIPPRPRVDRTYGESQRKHFFEESFQKRTHDSVCATHGPLVKNLNQPQYMRILLDGKASLEERFAEIDARLIRKELVKLSVSSDKVPPRIKKLIRRTDFLEQLVVIFTG